ncbi:MAG: hypothetical protein AB1633_06255, partial [Elusimicrobiota bacterium]
MKGLDFSAKESIKDIPIKTLKVHGKMIFHLAQNAGKPAVPIIRRNDKVLMGQKIADATPAQADKSMPVHSSVSGKVLDICNVVHPAKKTLSPAIIINSDGKDTPCNADKTHWDYYRYSPDELRNVLQQA